VRATQRQPKGHPLLIWGEYGDDALVVRDRGELVAALEALHTLFQAVAEATEEAIYNSMLRAVTTSYGDTTVEALPIDRVVEVLRKYGVR
jgi:hypothetical protein